MLLNCGVRKRLLRIPWTARRSNQSILKEISPEYSLKVLMLTLKLQYFGYLMQRTDSLEKTLMLVTTESRRRRGRQRMRWLDGITNSGNSPKSMSIKSVMPSNHLILCCSFLLPPSISPSIRVFSRESVLCIRWPKYWSCSFSVSPFNEYSGYLELTGSPCSPRDSQESSPTPQFKSINSSALSFFYGPTLTSIHNYWTSHSSH